MPCQPDASHILRWYTLIHSFSPRSHPKIRVWTCPTYQVRNKCICQHYPFWGSFSYGTNSHIWVHDFTYLLGSNLLLFHTPSPPQLTHKPCCQSAVKKEEIWFTCLTHQLHQRDLSRKNLPRSEDPEAKEVRRRRMDQAIWFRISLRATEYPFFPNIKMMSSHNVEETHCFNNRWVISWN